MNNILLPDRAQWISCAETLSSTLQLRCELELPEAVNQAVWRVSGLGISYASINDHAVNEAVLEPPYTAYHKRVSLRAYDVSHLLQQGHNSLSVELGNGFFHFPTPTVWNFEKASWFAQPCLRCHLVVTLLDGSVHELYSDEQWTAKSTATTRNCMLAGEDHDARLSGDALTTVVVDGPSGQLCLDDLEAITVQRDCQAHEIIRLGPESWLIDFRYQIAGWMTFTLQAAAGTRIRIRYGETRGTDGQVEQRFNPKHMPEGILATDHYTFAGQDAESWHPRFSYKGFRYVQIDGYPGNISTEQIRAQIVHSNLQRTAHVTSSCPTLNATVANTARTLLNNCHGIPTDTPSYEKNGWTGDAALLSHSMCYLFDVQRFLRKRVTDLADVMQADGSLPVIAPTSPDHWGYHHSPTWTIELLTHHKELYQFTGDQHFLQSHWDVCKRHVNFQRQELQNGLATARYGDWAAPGHPSLPPENSGLAATAFVYQHCRLAAELAAVLGDTDEQAANEACMQDIYQAFNKRYFDEECGWYRSKPDEGLRQSSLILPLAFGLVPAERVDAMIALLIKDIHDKGTRLDTGILATKQLLPLLSRSGHGDLAYTLASSRQYPSWGHWLEQGATTLWEHWDDDSRSLNHYMFGTICDWVFDCLAGLQLTQPGGGELHIEPLVPKGLSHFRTDLRLQSGPLSIAWQQDQSAGVFALETALSHGVRASVRLPDGSRHELNAGTKRLECRL